MRTELTSPHAQGRRLRGDYLRLARSRSPWSVVGRVVVALALSALAVLAAAGAVLAASIEYSGCFITSCGEPNELGGLALAVLAAGLLACAPLSVAVLFAHRGWARAAGVVLGLGLVLVLIGVGASSS